MVATTRRFGDKMKTSCCVDAMKVLFFCSYNSCFLFFNFLVILTSLFQRAYQTLIGFPWSDYEWSSCAYRHLGHLGPRISQWCICLTRIQSYKCTGFRFVVCAWVDIQRLNCISGNELSRTTILCGHPRPENWLTWCLWYTDVTFCSDSPSIPLLIREKCKIQSLSTENFFVCVWSQKLSIYYIYDESAWYWLDE